MKEVRYTTKFNGAIIEFKFVSVPPVPRRGYFKANIQPMVDVLKGLVPYTERQWNPSTYTWEISDTYWKLYQVILVQSGFKLTEVSGSTSHANVNIPKDYADNFYHAPPASPSSETTTSIASKLSAFLGVEIKAQDISELKKHYRRKALELHPDRNNGDGSKMSELNRLWTLYTAQDKVVN